MKKLVKYQLSDFRNVFLVYFLIMLVLHIWCAAGTLIEDGSGMYQVNSADFSSIIVFFITALSSFSETFNMWMQNHVSRKSIMKGLLLASIIVGAVNAVFDWLLVMIFKLVAAGNDSLIIGSGLSTSFPNYLEQAGTLAETVINLLFVTIGVAAFMMVGYFIAVIFYRAGKAARMVIAIGIPVSIFVALPIIIDTFSQTVVIEKFVKGFYFLIGATSGNPFYLLGTLTGVFIIFGALNYLLIIKMQVKGK